MEDKLTIKFQSPQWGSNSKGDHETIRKVLYPFQSPQWGSNSKEAFSGLYEYLNKFQSPQWGSNSKGEVGISNKVWEDVSVPAMGK